jgi:hypothetical protein
VLLRPFVFCFLAWKKSSERLTSSNNCLAGLESPLLYLRLSSLTLLQPLARGSTGGVVRTNEGPLPQKTRRSFLKASIPLEKGNKCRNSSVRLESLTYDVRGSVLQPRQTITFSNGLSGQVYASWSKPCQVILAPSSSTLGQAD